MAGRPCHVCGSSGLSRTGLQPYVCHDICNGFVPQFAEENYLRNAKYEFVLMRTLQTVSGAVAVVGGNVSVVLGYVESAMRMLWMDHFITFLAGIDSRFAVYESDMAAKGLDVSQGQSASHGNCMKTWWWDGLLNFAAIPTYSRSCFIGITVLDVVISLVNGSDAEALMKTIRYANLNSGLCGP